MRNLLEQALDKKLFSTAALIAEKICCQDESTPKDRILLAKCYQSAGEPRRCLAVLEQFGFLSAVGIDSLRRELLPFFDCGSTIPFDEYGISISLEAISMAARCLYSTEQFEGCINLLLPIVALDEDHENTLRIIEHSRSISCFESNVDNIKTDDGINPIACMYCLVGECYEKLDNRARAIRAFKIALQIDKICVEAILYLSDRGLLMPHEKTELCKELEGICEHRNWINSFLRVSLLQEEPARYDRSSSDVPQQDYFNDMRSSSGLIRQAAYCYNQQNFHDAYRLVRHAYTLDPHSSNGLIVYIASMTELSLNTELFYLGHELVNSSPKHKLSWYCVSCYYWSCGKYDLAQKYLLKATKIDKRFCEAWVLLGHVLSQQEEVEQAMAAYRTAARLMPGDHRPLICMAKELMRTNVLPLAQQMLLSAAKISPNDPGLLNELGVIAVKMGQLNSALQYFEKAVQMLSNHQQRTANDSIDIAARACAFRKSCGSELFSNYATALRKCEHYDDAIYWYDKCLAINPNDANIHASIGFTFHLIQRFDRAIVAYHQALAIRPKFTYCSDMLSRVMEDMSYFPTVQEEMAVLGVKDHKFDSKLMIHSSDSMNEGKYASTLAIGSPDQSVVNSFSNIAWRLSVGSDVVNAPVYPESPF